MWFYYFWWRRCYFGDVNAVGRVDLSVEDAADVDDDVAAAGDVRVFRDDLVIADEDIVVGVMSLFVLLNLLRLCCYFSWCSC